MDNEKDFQELTPEEKVKEDIGNAIADAASEIQDDINEANGVVEDAEFDDNIEDAESGEYTEGTDGESSWNDEAWDDTELETFEKEPVKVTLKKGTFIISLIAAALIGALISLACLKVPAMIANLPEGKTVANVGSIKITDLDMKYYIYAAAGEYASENKLSQDDLATFDWDKEVDGKKVSDIVRDKAIETAINEAILFTKGAANDVKLSDEDNAQITTQVAQLKSTFGEDGFALRAKTMGISSIKQYEKMFRNVLLSQAIDKDISENPSKYYPEDISVLNDYTADDKASVKHILIKEEAPAEGEDAAPAEGEEAAPAEDKAAKAQGILDRINNGEDFDALMKEFNEDTGEEESGYTFEKGSMVAEFEEAAFALGINEVSGLVKTSYGYHIIKRIPGKYELQAFWKDSGDVKVKINKNKIAKLSVSQIVKEAFDANEQVSAEEAAKKSSK